MGVSSEKTRIKAVVAIVDRMMALPWPGKRAAKIEVAREAAAALTRVLPMSMAARNSLNEERTCLTVRALF